MDCSDILLAQYKCDIYNVTNLEAVCIQKTHYHLLFSITVLR